MKKSPHFLRRFISLLTGAVMAATGLCAGGLPVAAADAGITFPTSLAAGNDGSIHDPSVFYDEASGYYYCYCTGITAQLNVIRTKDANMRGWESVSLDTSGFLPSEITAINSRIGNIWAPDMVKVGDEYRLYYSCSSSGSGDSCIALATSDKPDGDFTYRGIVLQSSTSTWNRQWNAIDPCIVYEEGTGDSYMTWGSFGGGIWIQKMTEDGFLDSNSSPVNIARRTGSEKGVEGPYIRYNADTGYYYLFVSYGDLNNNYNVRIGRSTSITGPYLDDQGNDMMNSTGTLSGDVGYKLTSGFQYEGGVWEGTGWMGLGHCSVYTKDDGTWLLYSHARINTGGTTQDSCNYGGLYMQVHQLLWSDEGWPLLVLAFYDGETVQQVSAGAMVGTFECIDIDKNDATVTQTSTEMTFSADGTFTGTMGSGQWDFTGTNKVTCFYTDSDRTEVLQVIPAWDQENQRGAYCITGYDTSEHLQIWGKKTSDNYNSSETVTFTPGWSLPKLEGDFYRDGVLDVQDVMTLAQIAVGSASLPDGMSGDLNGDGSVDVSDVMLLAQNVTSA